MKNTSVLFLLAGLFLWLAAPAAAIEPAALHTPPSDYQQTGSCLPDRGRLYVHREAQYEKPVLWYSGSRLTAAAYLMTERGLKNGEAVSLLGEFAGLPVSTVSFAFTTVNPFVQTPTTGRFYVLWVYLMQDGPRITVPC